MARPSALRRGPRGPSSPLTAGLLLLGAAVAALWGLAVRASGFAGGPSTTSLRGQSRPRPRTVAAAAEIATDGFDPWTVLGVSPQATVDEAKFAYKKLVAKYHPDVDPSPNAEFRLQQVVRAYAIFTGEDKKLDQATLLRNAVTNMHDELQNKRQRIAELKKQAEEEEKAAAAMSVRLETAVAQREELTKELGAWGGAAIGLVVAGPMGAAAGLVVGMVFKDQENAAGEVLRGTGRLVKSVIGSVVDVAQKSQAQSQAQSQSQTRP